MNDNIFSTKFILSLMILSMLFTLVVLGMFSVEQFAQWVSVIYGTYVAGNVVQKFSPESK